MATLKKIPDSYLTPVRNLPQAELADCVIVNPKSGRLLIYGTRDTRQSDPPHDHGQDGGEVLRDVTPFTVTVGPEKTLSGPQVGIQIQRTSGFGSNPRVLLTCGVPLRAGVTELTVSVPIAFDSVADITLYVTLRPYAETNRDFEAGLHVTEEVTYTPGAAPDEAVVEVELTDLTPLGDSRYDREVELVIWQAYLPPATVTSGHRLMGVYGEVSGVQSVARSSDRNELTRQLISYSEVKTLAILGQDFGKKVRDTHNGLMRGMLGRAPGLTNDGRSDPTRPYRQSLSGAHTHQGIDVPDGCGSFYSDGAVLRDTLFLVCLSHANPTAGVVEDYSGALCHGSGTFGASSLTIEARASIPAGLGAMDVRFALKVGSSQQNTRLLLHADVRGFDGVSICTGVSSGVHQQQSELDGDALYVCEVDPLDNNLFVPSRKRRLARAGLWSLAALRSPTPASGMRASNVMISEQVRLNLTHPKIRSSDTPHATADYMVTLRFELQTPEGASAVDATTKLNWALGLPSRGF